MLSVNKNIKLFALSVVNLFLVFGVYVILQWAAMQLGALISGFTGQLVFADYYCRALAEEWTAKNVHSIYLLPWLGWLLIYNIIPHRRKFPTKSPLFLQMAQGWITTLLLTIVFWLPLTDILLKTGIYYSLLWMGIPYYLQIIIGSIIAIMFITKLFSISRLFSTTLSGKIINTTVSGKSIFVRLIFLLYLPTIALAGILYLISGIHYLTIISGISILVILNSILMLRYNIIIPKL